MGEIDTGGQAGDGDDFHPAVDDVVEVISDVDPLGREGAVRGGQAFDRHPIAVERRDAEVGLDAAILEGLEQELFGDPQAKDVERCEDDEKADTEQEKYRSGA